jgi:hypothetical protein
MRNVAESERKEFRLQGRIKKSYTDEYVLSNVTERRSTGSRTKKEPAHLAVPAPKRNANVSAFYAVVLRWKKCTIMEITANKRSRWINALEMWNTRKPPSHASNRITNSMRYM